MIFNSIEFLVFFIATIVVFYAVKPSLRWAILILSSLVFISYNVPLFAIILIPVIVFNYFSGILIDNAEEDRPRRIIFLFSIFINISFFVFFKYTNFIIDNINFISDKLSLDSDIPGLTILLPLGISFYVFQVISYNIDIYWGMSKAERHFGYFSVYIAFFPKFISGPIERANDFLPQLKAPKAFLRKDIRIGLQLILWGLVKKLVIADTIAPTTDLIFNNVENYHGIAILIGLFLYVIQIYSDFSGYTDIALGTARMLGFKLTDNFNRPFSATSISDFWRRWHISLSSWVTDYIFRPVSASVRNWYKLGTVVALIITFVTLGFWHGASWNFIIYGALHALAVSYEYLTTNFRKKLRSNIRLSIYKPISRILTITYLGFTMLFFRFETTSQAISAINNIFIDFSFTISGLGLGLSMKSFIIIILGIIFIELIERYKDKDSAYDLLMMKFSPYLRYIIYYIFILIIMLFGTFGASEFLYFQF